MVNGTKNGLEIAWWYGKLKLRLRLPACPAQAHDRAMKGTKGRVPWTGRGQDTVVPVEYSHESEDASGTREDNSPSVALIQAPWD